MKDYADEWAIVEGGSLGEAIIARFLFEDDADAMMRSMRKRRPNMTYRKTQLACGF